MRYTSHEYLDHMIQMAIDDGCISQREIERLTDVYGNNHEGIMIDILSMIFQRRKDLGKLQRFQRIWLDYREDKASG